MPRKSFLTASRRARSYMSVTASLTHGLARARCGANSPGGPERGDRVLVATLHGHAAADVDMPCGAAGSRHRQGVRVDLGGDLSGPPALAGLDGDHGFPDRDVAGAERLSSEVRRADARSPCGLFCLLHVGVGLAVVGGHSRSQRRRQVQHAVQLSDLRPVQPLVEPVGGLRGDHVGALPGRRGDGVDPRPRGQALPLQAVQVRGDVAQMPGRNLGEVGAPRFFAAAQEAV